MPSVLGSLVAREINRLRKPLTIIRHNNTADLANYTQRFVNVVSGDALRARLSDWQAFIATQGKGSLSRNPLWLSVLEQGRGDVPYCLEAVRDNQVVGILPLALVASPLFGRFLVSLPHVSSGGVCCDNPYVAVELADQAMDLADQLEVDYLELRHEKPLPHPRLQQVVTDKAHMRMELPADEAALWKKVGPKVRNQVRKSQQLGFSESWGGLELLDAFYALYARRMRDFGVPVDGKVIFEQILAGFPDSAEFIVIRQQDQPVGAAMVLHGDGQSEMHRSATLTSLRSTGLNTWMHWHSLLRAQARGNVQFDFGRPTVGSSVYTFKKRFGATPTPAVVQHYLRRGSPEELRRSSGKFNLPVKLWSCLPVCTTRWIGPMIARALP